MLSRLIFFVATALFCCATAFPLSTLLAPGPYGDPRLYASQLLSLHDGTYLALISSQYPVADLELNPGVRTVTIPSEVPISNAAYATIVARLQPANDSVIWAYDVSYFDATACAVVDDAGGIFVVGDTNDFIDFEYFSGFRLFRFSVDGEATWGEFYTDKALGLPRRIFFFSGANYQAPFAALAGPRTLAILGVARVDPSSLGRNAIFVDTITREARLVRFPLPNGPSEFVESGAVAADSASGAACFADITRGENTLRGQTSFKNRRLFVQCVNARGEGEIVSRILVPFQEDAVWDLPQVIMGGGGEGKAAVLYVVAIRSFPPGPAKGVPPHAPTYSQRVADVTEMLLFKLDPTTLQDVEWESGLISTKPTMRKLLLKNSSRISAGTVMSLRLIRDQNALVVLYEADAVFSEIETLPDGTVAFLGDGQRQFLFDQWLLYFGSDAEPVAIRIPQDPRPDGEQDGFDAFLAKDFELSKDGRDLYLFGGLQTSDLMRYGELVTVPFGIPAFAQLGAGSPDMGDGLEDSFDESFEPSPDETAETILDEELEPSTNPLQEQRYV